MKDTQVIEVIKRYINARKDFLTRGKLYVLLALEVYKASGESLEDVLEKLERFKDISGVAIDTEDMNFMLEHKQEVIEYCCDCQAHELFDERWLFKTPEAVSELMVRLADVKDGERVYLPFLGLGENVRHISADCIIEGEEIEPTIWALGQIREWANGNARNNLICGDSFERMSMYSNSDNILFAEELPKYDAIIMAPPYRVSMPDNPRKEMLLAAIEQSFPMLSDQGRIVVLVDSSIHSKYYAEKFREDLVSNGYLSAVISIPGELYTPITLISFDIWVISKKSCNKTVFVDASSFVVPNTIKPRILDYEKTWSIYIGNDAENKITIDIKDVDSNKLWPGYNLFVRKKYHLRLAC